MRILQINAVYGNGSTGTICKDFAAYAESLGHTVLTLYSEDSENKYDNAVPVSNSLSVKFNSLLARISGYNAHFCFSSTRKSIKEIKKFNPDIVHLHNLHGNYINLPVLLTFLKKNDIATVVTLHDTWFFTGKCSHYTAVNCEKWKTGCNNCPKLKSDIPSWFFDRTNAMWNEKKELFNSLNKLGVVGVSNWITNEGKKSFLANNAVFTRIYNSIETDIYKECLSLDKSELLKRYNIPNSEFYAVCVSNDWSIGSDRLNDFIALTKSSENITFLIVGNIDKSIKFGNNVVAIGYLSERKELAKLYNFSDVYIHLSREDTFGKVISEALACGTPVIVYNSTACAELITSENGVICDVGNTEDIIKALSVIKSNGKKHYSQNCIKTALEFCEKTSIMDSQLDFYKQLLN